MLEGQATLALHRGARAGPGRDRVAAILGAVPRPGAGAAVGHAGLRAGAAGGAGGADLSVSRRRGVHALVDHRAGRRTRCRTGRACRSRPSRSSIPSATPGGDVPVPLAFAPTAASLYEDVLGENEIRVLLAGLAGSDEVQTVVPIGWGGDRYRVYEAPGGPALVWYVVWDDAALGGPASSGAPARGSSVPARPGYRATLDRSLSPAGRRRAMCSRPPAGRGGGRCRRRGGPGRPSARMRGDCRAE